MKRTHRAALLALALSSALMLPATQAQTPAPASGTDVYHVLFAKAAPGQAAALVKELQEVDPKDPMGSHFLLLRHQWGDDWDYCLIQHVGTKASVEVTNANPNRPPTMAWHTDSYAAGPSWGELTRVMMPAASDGKSSNSVYVVAVHRAIPGHRGQLEKLLKEPRPNAKTPIATVVLTHLEGGPWNFVSIDRYGSWQDLATDAAASLNDPGWASVRDHSAFHHDTLADRIVSK
jgi:hypothetical protein